VFMFLLAAIHLFSNNAFEDKLRIKRNDDWKKYLLKMREKLTPEEFAAFQYYSFETGALPGNDFSYVKDEPLKKYKIKDYENVKIKTRDNLKIDGWFFPVKDAKGTLIILHGWGSDIAFGLYQSQFLIENGYQILVYNARYWNFSKYPQKYLFSFENELNDVKSVIDYLKGRKDVDSKKIGIYGFSQGGFKTILAGARFTELKVVIEDAAPNSRLWWGNDQNILKIIKDKTGEDPSDSKYDALYQVDKISPRPLLILQGGKDTSVPPEISDAIFEKALSPKEYKIFPNSTHCLGMRQSDKTEYIKSVVDFLDRYLKE
nr:prolyl oligopeptidase family serine peptidase [Spirochaetota bacterium]